MRKKIISFFVLPIVILCLVACSGDDSYFSIQFIDVGQGDSALVECDDHYMLIDGGGKSAGDKVYSVLKEKEIQHLDLLAISHMHADHYGGLKKALTYTTTIDKTISNTVDGDADLLHQLKINGSEISVPNSGTKYRLGSATVEVVDVSAKDENDSLVLLITYGDTKYLFTGDIEEKAQSRIANQYQNEFDKPFKIDLLKMPHHGGKVSILFIRTFMPDYAVISVGEGKQYGHPVSETLERLEQADIKTYRTDIDGDIIVKSDGNQLFFETSK